MTITGFLAQQFKNIGLQEGDTVLIHSDLKQPIGELIKTFGTDQRISAQTFLNALLETVGSTGTLVFPTFNFTAWPKNQFFDIRQTSSEMGILTEVARKQPGSVRTGHPIYSFVVIGDRSDFFSKTDNVSGYGPDSPFAVLEEINAKILAIGLSDQKCMTSYHYAEEKNFVPYRYFKDFKGTYLDKHGTATPRTYKLYVRNIDEGVVTDLDRMEEYLWEKNLYKGTRHNEGLGMRLIAMRTLIDETTSKIKNGNAINYLYRINKP